MATVIIRPDATLSSSGFNATSNLLKDLISDDNPSTAIVQNQLSSTFTVTLSNLPASFQEITINSITATIVGVSGRSGESSVIVEKSAGLTLLNQSALYFSGGAYQTLHSTTYSTNLNYTIVNSLRLIVTPNTQGITISEVYLTVDYNDESNGKIQITKGLVQLTKGKVIL